MLTLSQFETNYYHKSVWSDCTGNKAAGIPPQCQDLANLWSTNLGKGCFPRKGNAKDIFANADPAKWTKVKNTPDGVPPAGAVIIFGGTSAHPNGHVCIDRGKSTTSVMYTYDQNWSWANHVTNETHNYHDRPVIGWLIHK